MKSLIKIIILVGIISYGINVVYGEEKNTSPATPAVQIESKGDEFCGLSEVDCSGDVAYPSEQNRTLKIINNATVYAYNSEVGQTDDTPFITADGYDLRNGDKVIANNCLPFGTLVEVQGVEYQVRDRMNQRYTKCGENDTWVFDIWMPDRQDALNWGKKIIDVIVKN